MGEMSKFLAIGQDFSPSPGLPMKVQGKGEPVHTWWVQQFCDIFGKKGDAWHMILGDNPTQGLSCIELFQISHNCVTECMLQAKFLLKLV